MHDSAYADADRFVSTYLKEFTTLNIADIGSYDVNGSMKPLFNRPGWVYTGFDQSAGLNVDCVLTSPYNWENVDNATFDVVVSTQTLEHVRHPWKWMPELARICKPGGLIYVCSPNTWSYHEYPIDCWRIWPEGMRALFEDAGIHVLEACWNGPDTTGIGRRL